MKNYHGWSNLKESTTGMNILRILSNAGCRRQTLLATRTSAWDVRCTTWLQARRSFLPSSHIDQTGKLRKILKSVCSARLWRSPETFGYTATGICVTLTSRPFARCGRRFLICKELTQRSQPPQKLLRWGGEGRLIPRVNIVISCTLFPPLCESIVSLSLRVCL